MFLDRPNMIVEAVGTSDFVSNWTTGQNSFAGIAAIATLQAGRQATYNTLNCLYIKKKQAFAIISIIQ
jgi:hypothetical protein